MKQRMKQIARTLGLEYCGVTSVEKGSAVVCLFPYYMRFEKGNLSRYAAVRDYHAVCLDYLQRLQQAAGLPCPVEKFADISPYCDVELAWRAGLGVIGKNGLLINQAYGSYVFIGYLVLDGVFLEPDKPLPGGCAGCNACVRACPGNALGQNGIAVERCLSAITQKKGELTAEETGALRRGGLIWGCDRCSEVCPHNRGVRETPLPEFREEIKPFLRPEELEGLSEREFRKKFSDRAYTWRGKKVLVRNLDILGEKSGI